MAALLLLLLVTLASAPSVEAGSGWACQATCGGVDIPLPIWHRRQLLPPRLCDHLQRHYGSIPFLAGTDYKVLNGLSVVPAGARVELLIASTCYDRSGNRRSSEESEAPVSFNPQGVYRISDQRNQLVVIGCDVTAYIQSRRDNSSNTAGYHYEYEYYTGCVSYCRTPESAKDGRCAGVGCCRVDIPPDLTNNSVVMDYDDNSSLAVRRLIYDFSPCSYGFLVDRNSYTFRHADLKMDKRQTMPVWLDWAIRPNGSSAFTCSDAMNNSSSYACKSRHSDAANGPGYTCNCSEGYEGNAFIVDGCTGVICGVACLIALLIFILMMNEKRKLQAFYELNGGPLLASINSIKIYTKHELSHMTRNFSIVLGAGSLGQVYKGFTNGNQMVAVKKLSAQLVKSRKDELYTRENGKLEFYFQEKRTKEFANEIKIQSEIKHKNILRLLGCCLEVEIPMLVYEFAPKGSLWDLLHGTDGTGTPRQRSIPLPLQKRLDISAEALFYMHSSANQKILHGDVKSGNILLDEKLMPKLSDFGTSKLLSIQIQRTIIVGDPDYIDPVYKSTGRLDEKSDVYSFGVVLELITGKKPAYDGNNSLIKNFFKAYATEDKAREMFDEEIASPDENIEILQKVGSIAIACLKELKEAMEDRPTMKEVAEELDRMNSDWKQRHDAHTADEICMEIPPVTLTMNGVQTPGYYPLRNEMEMMSYQ
ncbi:hypothetical protein U9M48_006636 [Paspalum notatum var. saurae]|uniref:Protein kinase domain-containing protein n=1 Tax=Paspalum notatum var. saurae TaxID=547442 RepID=A0AAQ3PSR8_PASNO